MKNFTHFSFSFLPTLKNLFSDVSGSAPGRSAGRRAAVDTCFQHMHTVKMYLFSVDFMF